MSTIPRDVAQKICLEIQGENRGKRYILGGLQCWGCTTFTKGDPAKMCLSNPKGCNLVNKRYAQQKGSLD